MPLQYVEFDRVKLFDQYWRFKLGGMVSGKKRNRIIVSYDHLKEMPGSSITLLLLLGISAS